VRPGAVVAGVAAVISGALVLRIRDSRAVAPEMVQVRFHVAESEIAIAGPLVDDAGDGEEAIRVSSLQLGYEATLDEQVAMDQLVQECGEKESPVIVGMVEDRVGKHNERFVPALGCGPEGRRPDQLRPVSFLGWVRPFPSYSTGKDATEKDPVRCSQETIESLFIDGEWALNQVSKNSFMFSMG